MLENIKFLRKKQNVRNSFKMLQNVTNSKKLLENYNVMSVRFRFGQFFDSLADGAKPRVFLEEPRGAVAEHLDRALVEAGVNA